MTTIPQIHAHPVAPEMGVDACATASGQACWTYAFLDDERAWLYVGIAHGLRERLMQHKWEKAWWPQVGLISASLHCCRRHAADDEAWAIRAHADELRNVARPRPWAPEPQRSIHGGVSLLRHRGAWVSLL